MNKILQAQGKAGNVGRAYMDWLNSKPVNETKPCGCLRQEVLYFAIKMESRLAEKDEERADSWKTLNLKAATLNVLAKGLEIDRVLRDEGSSDHAQKAIAQHAVDLGNYAMFLADLCGALAIDLEDDGGEGWAGADHIQPGEKA